MTVWKVIRDLRDGNVRRWTQRLRALSRHSQWVTATSAAQSRAFYSLGLDARGDRSVEQSNGTRRLSPHHGAGSRRFALEKRFIGGEGNYLIDENGARYADFAAGSSATPFGHRPKRLLRALEARRLACDALEVSAHGLRKELETRLLALAPVGFRHAVLVNSGVQALETAIKLACAGTGRTGILKAEGQEDLISGAQAMDGHKALPSNFVSVPSGSVQALDQAFKSSPERFAAFIVEPLLGEFGLQLPPPGYLAAALGLCHRFGALLILDETQCGLGRAGALLEAHNERLVPDLLVLGDSLGGGLVSIGACLCTQAPRGHVDDLLLQADPAECALACQVALATIEELTQENQHLLRCVASMGRLFRTELEQVQMEFPTFVAGIRGTGLMLGMELNLDRIAQQGGLFAVWRDQSMLPFILLSYLVNAHRIHVSLSSRNSSVLRIEPPLIADAELCAHLTAALRLMLGMVQRRAADELIVHLADELFSNETLGPEERRQAAARTSLPEIAYSMNRCDRFAYVVHLLDAADFRRFDPSLKRFSDGQLELLRKRFVSRLKPFPIDKLVIHRPDGVYSEGELIIIPNLPSELVALPGPEAVDLVQSAVDLGVSRGARVVGLGGFTSIITYGGNALVPQRGVTVTSGNSLTTWAALRSVEAACDEQGLAMADCTVAVVGANGAIGQALSTLLAARAGELILIGNPSHPDASIRKLRRVARDCCRYVKGLAAGGHEFPIHSIAARLLSGQTEDDAALQPLSGLTLTTDIGRELPRAHVVFTATREILPFIGSHHLRQGAVVCDVSRPSNVVPEVVRKRLDVRLVGGGLIKAPETSTLGFIEEPHRPKVLMSCAAETLILALSGYRGSHLCGRLDIETIQSIGRQAEALGFAVVG